MLGRSSLWPIFFLCLPLSLLHFTSTLINPHLAYCFEPRAPPSIPSCPPLPTLRPYIEAMPQTSTPLSPPTSTEKFKCKLLHGESFLSPHHAGTTLGGRTYARTKKNTLQNFNLIVSGHFFKCNTSLSHFQFVNHTQRLKLCTYSEMFKLDFALEVQHIRSFPLRSEAETTIPHQVTAIRRKLCSDVETTARRRIFYKINSGLQFSSSNYSIEPVAMLNYARTPKVWSRVKFNSAAIFCFKLLHQVVHHVKTPPRARNYAQTPHSTPLGHLGDSKTLYQDNIRTELMHAGQFDFELQNSTTHVISGLAGDRHVQALRWIQLLRPTPAQRSEVFYLKELIVKHN
ncbi:hypothetical protein B0H16DRAFT_1458232 [Mycena metata]|uniref:Uncharacterized protein n=1 Tax=Mycena metata TaxID=1033252 RepID=A0AAD7J5S1_9AGAR|nr:hypothetical protein B0H16DRAFT_1458232 [Mycena metata]